MGIQAFTPPGGNTQASLERIMSVNGAYTVTGNTVKLTAATSAPTPVQCSSTTLGGNQYRIINASTTQGCFLSFAQDSATATGQVYATVSGGSGTPTLSANAEL